MKPTQPVGSLQWLHSWSTASVMSPNTKLPLTEEEARLRAKSRSEKDAEEARRRAMQNIDDEPCGKLTNPSDIDRHRDRKNED